MSRQQGDAPDAPEIVGVKVRKRKIAKPYEIWKRPTKEFVDSHNYGWLKFFYGKKDYTAWRRDAAYVTKELAEYNLAKKKRETNWYEFEIRVTG